MKKVIFACSLMLGLVAWSSIAVSASITFTFTEFHAEVNDALGFYSQTTDTPPATAGGLDASDAWASTTGVNCQVTNHFFPGIPISASAYSKLRFVGTFSQLFVEFYTYVIDDGSNQFSLDDKTMGIQLLGVSNPGYYANTIALSAGHSYEIFMGCSATTDIFSSESAIYGLTLSGVAPLPSTLSLLGSSLLGCFILRARNGRRS